MPRAALVLITALVLMRQVVGAFHGHAHALLDIPMAHWRHLFINVVIGGAPFVALALLWLLRTPAAGWLVVAVVAAGSLFGLYFHFGPRNPDHIAMLPDLPGRALFIVTAWLLAGIELLTVAITAWFISTRIGTPERFRTTVAEE
jgi:hypothetical protein